MTREEWKCAHRAERIARRRGAALAGDDGEDIERALRRVARRARGAPRSAAPAPARIRWPKLALLARPALVFATMLLLAMATLARHAGQPDQTSVLVKATAPAQNSVGGAARLPPTVRS